MRQHTSAVAYVSIRQQTHTSAYVSRRIQESHCALQGAVRVATRKCNSIFAEYSSPFHIPGTTLWSCSLGETLIPDDADVSQHTSACVCIRQHASAYVSMRLHTSPRPQHPSDRYCQMARCKDEGESPARSHQSPARSHEGGLIETRKSPTPITKKQSNSTMKGREACYATRHAIRQQKACIRQHMSARGVLCHAARSGGTRLLET